MLQAICLLLIALAPFDASAQHTLNCAPRSAAGSRLEKVIVPTAAGAKRFYCHYADSAVVTLRLNADCELSHVDMIDEVAHLRECHHFDTNATKCQVVCGAR